jgi:hypothetical protein
MFSKRDRRQPIPADAEDPFIRQIVQYIEAYRTSWGAVHRVIYDRQEDTLWQRRIAGAGERVELTSIGCDLDVDRAYLKVFEASPGSP